MFGSRTEPAPIPRVAVTPGEPAGIGPDLTVRLAQRQHAAECVAVADPALLEQAAKRLGLAVTLREFRPDAAPEVSPVGQLSVAEVPLRAPARPGRLEPANSPYVLECLDQAVDLCRDGKIHALVTGPVHKGVINDAGTPFIGHTEYLAKYCGADDAVMMLVSGAFRIALVTTHMPLARVPESITAEKLESTIRVTHRSLRNEFGLPRPRLLVLGLNPHAGEGGHLGREEIDVIEPVLDRLRATGIKLRGPMAADTAFTPAVLEGFDVVVAMYHDQGLPVLKHAGFGRAVNITLGLPIVRTSVDHGTGLDIAGTSWADPSSLHAAVDQAIEMARRLRLTAPA